MRTESRIPLKFFFLFFLPLQGNRRSVAREVRETQHFSKSHNHVYRNEAFIPGHWRNDLTGQSFSTKEKRQTNFPQGLRLLRTACRPRVAGIQRDHDRAQWTIMVGVPVFSDWRQFSATLIHVHVSTHCVTFRVSHSSSRTMYLGRSLSRSSSSSPPNEHDFSRGEHHAGLRSPRVTCQPTKTTRYLSLRQLETKTPRLVKTASSPPPPPSFSSPSSSSSSSSSLFLLCKISRISIRATDVHRINRYYLGWYARLLCVSVGSKKYDGSWKI